MIPTDRQVANGTFRKFDGRWYKVCRGPAHEFPEYLLATEKYFHVYKTGPRKGSLKSRCRLCSHWETVKPETRGSERGIVTVESVHLYFVEAANRAGITELSRRTGLTKNTLGNVLNRKQPFVRRMTVRLVMLELISMKRKGEFPINNYARAKVIRRTNTSATEFCAGCRTTLDNYTANCSTCWERRTARRDQVKSDKKAAPV